MTNYQMMSRERAKAYLETLLDLDEEQMCEEWLLDVEEALDREFPDCDTAKKYLNWEIDDVDEWILGYDAREREREEYIHMVAEESRYW